MEPSLLRPEIAGLLPDMKAEGISAVIDTDDGFYIVKVEGRQKGAVAVFEDVQSQVERDLRQEAGKALYQAWIASLKQNAYVKVFDIAPYLKISPL